MQNTTNSNNAKRKKQLQRYWYYKIFSIHDILLRRAFLTIDKSSIRPDLDYGDPFCSKIKVYSILQR